MPSRREQITLDDAEIAAYLEAEKTVIVGTNGPRGVPHLMPVWFVMRGTEVWSWTFAKSQKAKNLERDPRATLLVEDGATAARTLYARAGFRPCAGFIAARCELQSRVAAGSVHPHVAAGL